MLPVIICCGGHGKVMRPGKSKLGDHIGGTPIIVRAVENAKSAGLYPIIAVINPLLGPELKDILEKAGHGDVRYVFQRLRRGAANAIFRALPMLLEECKAGQFLGMFGEMPFIRPETLRELACVHLHTKPQLSFLYSPMDSGHSLAPVLEGYAHLKQGWNNGHRDSSFLSLYDHHRATDGDDVLGSVYVFETCWFAENYRHIKGMDNKHDGFGPEYHLPKLVEMAIRNGDRYEAVRKNVPEQIIGINNIADYRTAEAICLQHYGRS